jgi:enoyl-CoA hydratase
MGSVFGLDHLAHAHNADTGTGSLAGHNARTMRDAQIPPS